MHLIENPVNPFSNINVEVWGQKYVPDDREYQFFKLKSGKTDE